MLLRTPADIGLLIRDRRRSLGVRQVDLARKVGVSRQWMVEVEQGKAGAALGLVLRTLAALDIDLHAQGDEAQADEPGRTAAGTGAPTIDIDSVIDKARGGKP